jgi:hypothetical protein
MSRTLLFRFLLTLFGALLLTGTGAGAREPRSREWLLRTLLATPSLQARGAEYLTRIDRADLLKVLDLEWLKSGEQSASGRLYATMIGQLAFAYHTPGTRWHRDRRLLELVRAGFRGFQQHQNEEGRFVWPKQGTYEFQAQEHVWRLEPLLCAYIWTRDDLEPGDREAWEPMLRRGAEYLLKRPLTEQNNRGLVWCLGAQLCGLYFEDPRLLELVNQHAPRITAGVVSPAGELAETQGGGGPDSNYSYVSLPYLHAFRVLSGRDELDEPLLRAVRWVVRYCTLDGTLLAPGASTRIPRNRGDVEMALPSLEEYSTGDPFLAEVAKRYLAAISAGSFGRAGLTVHPYVWALLRNQGVAAVPDPPRWYSEHTGHYSWRRLEYVLIGRPGYRAGLSARSDHEVRGLQTFALGDEPPLLAAGANLRMQSGTLVASAAEEEERRVYVRNADEVLIDPSSAPLTLIVTRHGHRWICYALTPRSLVVFYGGGAGSLVSRWEMDGVPEPAVDTGRRRVSSPQRRGQLFYLNGDAVLQTYGGVPQLEVTAGGPNAFGFSDESFAFGKVDGGRLTFSDSTGRYVLDLNRMLDTTGAIERDYPFRLTRLPD